MKYLALWFFIGGVLLIVFIQFMSGQNVNRQISGNKHLLNEVRIQNDLRKLESEVLSIESDIRGAIITEDSVHLTNLRGKITDVHAQLNNLKTVLTDSTTEAEVRALDTIVQKKIAFSYEIINSYRTRGKDAGEEIINTGRGKAIRDSMISVIDRIDAIRQNNLNQIINSIERNGQRARFSGIILAIIACLACIYAFLYIVNKGRQQERMIVKLNESEKKIKEGAFVKEQFLANMSHEIRTPMNAILGFTNLLKRTGLSYQQVQYVDYIHSSCQNLLSLINDILDLSKIEAGMMNIEEAPFSINGLINSVEVMFHEKAKQKGLQFNVHVDKTIPDTLSGDAVRMTQILMNLLSNAIKFSEKGFVSLEVKPLHIDEDIVELEFVVQDSGVGIAPEKLRSIFDRFQQGDAETTRRFGGTGLGLSIVKQLVDIQHGSIDVSSKLGSGTRFTIRLPFRTNADYSEKHAVQTEQIEGTLKNIRVLIAEDNQMNQHLMKHLMNQWQVDHLLVNNGREAVDALRKEKFAVVLMDIQMPVLDGYVASQIIRNELKDDVPIIAMTAHAMVGEKERCLSYGMNDYISKPIKETELYSILKIYGYRNHDETVKKKVIDLGYLRELSLGDAEFESTIIRQFIVQVPEELDLLEEAISIRNKQQIKSIAHGMKSSIAYLGLTDLLSPYLNRMELESVADIENPHFEDDIKYVRSVCEQAIHEAKILLSATN